MSIFIWTARVRPNSLFELAITSLLFCIRSSIFFLYTSGTLMSCDLISVYLILVGPFSIYLTCFLMFKDDMFLYYSPLGTLFYCPNLLALLGSSIFSCFSPQTQPVLLLRPQVSLPLFESPGIGFPLVVQWGLI